MLHTLCHATPAFGFTWVCIGQDLKAKLFFVCVAAKHGLGDHERQLYASRQVQHHGGRCLVNCRKGMSRSAEASRIFEATFKLLQRDSKVGLTSSTCLRPRRKGSNNSRTCTLAMRSPSCSLTSSSAKVAVPDGLWCQMQQRRDSGKPDCPCQPEPRPVLAGGLGARENATASLRPRTGFAKTQWCVSARLQQRGCASKHGLPPAAPATGTCQTRNSGERSRRETTSVLSWTLRSPHEFTVP